MSIYLGRNERSLQNGLVCEKNSEKVESFANKHKFHLVLGATFRDDRFREVETTSVKEIEEFGNGFFFF